MLAHLEELEEAGIDSIKIEGRNKKAFYVATVVDAYRNVLDGKPVTDFARELELVSHRPYSTGFYFGPAHRRTLPMSARSSWNGLQRCSPATSGSRDMVNRSTLSQWL